MLLLVTRHSSLLFTGMKSHESLEQLVEVISRSQQGYRELIDSFEDLVFTISLDGQILTANRALAELVGKPFSRLIGHPLDEFLAEPSRETLLKARPLFLETRSWAGTVVIALQDVPAARFFFNCLLRAVVKDDEVVGISVLARDMTRQREMETRFTELFETLQEGVYFSTPEGKLLDVNPALVQMLGYASKEELVGVNINHLRITMTPDPAAATLSLSREREMTLRRPDGSTIICLNVSNAIRDTSGRVIRNQGTLVNITERKQAEDALRQAQKMEAIGQLAGGVAHDFNNLLTVIKGYADLLMPQVPEESRSYRAAEEIKGAADRAASLTRQLLAFSRRQILEPKVLDLNQVIRNVEKMLRRLIGEDIELVTRLDSNLQRVKADPGQMEQILLNLAVNSRDAMPDGGVITIETSNVDLGEDHAANLRTAPGRYVMLLVSDTGHGIDKETQARIFEPFFTTKEQGKGTGLGLSTVYGIVMQSGGGIRVESAPGCGAQFYIYLPPTAEEGVERAAPRETGAGVRHGSETVLLVDDDAKIRELVGEILRMRGYTVLEACDGAEAVAISERHEGPIHLLLTDIVMPRMNGREVARRLQAQRGQVKVLFMSGYTRESSALESTVRAGTAFIQKPFATGDLLRKLAEVLASA